MKSEIKSRILNHAQMLVLQVVKESYYSESDLEELRSILLEFNHRKMQEHHDETVAKKGYVEEDFEKILVGHHRKSH